MLDFQLSYQCAIVSSVFMAPVTYPILLPLQLLFFLPDLSSLDF